MKIEKIQKAFMAELKRDVRRYQKNGQLINDNCKRLHTAPDYFSIATLHCIVKYQGLNGQFIPDEPTDYKDKYGQRITIPPFYTKIEKAWPHNDWNQPTPISLDVATEIIERHLISSHCPDILLVKIGDLFFKAENLCSKLKLIKRINGNKPTEYMLRTGEYSQSMPMIWVNSGNISLLLLGFKNEKLKKGTYECEHFFSLDKALEHKESI